ncbi:MAG: hypothetical protein JST78_04650 [Bacteroidetes bacterium]|nr:hypothetical protein [Bacteroidota bacterium]
MKKLKLIVLLVGVFMVYIAAVCSFDVSSLLPSTIQVVNKSVTGKGAFINTSGEDGSVDYLSFEKI